MKASLAALLGLVLTLPQAVITGPPAAADPAPTLLSVKVDFAPAGGGAATWTTDTGAAYTDAAGSGWVREDSLGGTRVPLDLTKNTRNRTTGSCTGGTLQGRTFIHMQNPAISATNTPIFGAWEYALANGQYKVEVGYGDANPGADPESHTLNAEGVNLVKGDAASPSTVCGATSRMRMATGWATVTDGKLTIDGVGGTNTKLAWVTIDSVPVAGLTATVTGATSIALDWADVDGAAGYKVWRSEALPTPAAGQAGLTQLGSPTASEFTDTTAVKGTLYHYAVGTSATAAALNGSVVQALGDDASPTRPTLPLKVNFQDRTGATPSGFVADYGRNYSNTQGFGWVVPGTGTPLGIVGNGRTRTADATAPAPLNTMMHAQYNATGSNQTNGVHRQGAWQVAVADGRYDVELTVGDAAPGTDPTRHVVNVEGANAVTYVAVSPTGVALTGANRFRTVTVPDVAVTDGFLTVDAIGGTNTKLTDLTVAVAAPVNAAPATPTGLTATPGNGAVTLDWADNDEAEDDLAGYRVYRSETATVPTTGTPLSGATLLTDSTYVDSTAVNGTSYSYVVVAVDEAGKTSTATSVVSATPDTATPTLVAVPFQVNFVAADTAVGAGFEKDFGQAYSNQRGYGWVSPTTGAPLNLVGNGRLREERVGVTVDLRQRGLVHLQADDVAGTFNGVKTEGEWEIAVPNGSYRVTVSAGDQPGANNVYDSVHELNVEGVTAIDGFQATAADEFETATVVATVDDGKLTIDAAGGTNTKINYVDVAVADVDAPEAPQGLEVTEGDEQNVLDWDANTEGDLAGYHVYASTSPTVALTAANRLTPATPQVARALTHTGLTNGTAYHYVVTAVDEAGNESVASTTVDATPGDRTAPDAPSDLDAAAGDGFVTLTWTASTADDVAAYRVYRGVDGDLDTTGTPLARVDDPAVTYTDDAVTNGTQYVYAVVAVDADGNASGASASATATPVDDVAPSAPVDVNAAAGDREVTLSWSAGQASDVASFRVYRDTTADVAISSDTRVATTEDPTYVDTGLVNGTTYYYRITALDEVDNQSEGSVEVSATPVPDPDLTPPAVPDGVTADGGDNRVRISWDDVTGSNDLRGYRVYRSATASGTGTLVSGATPVTESPYVDTTAINGTAYFYRVTSVDTTGNESARSAEVSATPADTEAPAAPTGVTATAGVNNVTVTWDAAPEGSDVTRYRIYRSRTSSSFPTGFDQFGTFLATRPRTYIDANVTVGTTYYYAVTALDDAEPANESGVSGTPNATPLPTPDTTPPLAASGLTATVDDDDVNLDWTASPSTDTAGYEVYRSATAGALGTKISSGIVTGTIYTDQDLPAGSTSYYTVVALDTSSNQAGPSNQASATIAAAGVDLAYAFQPDTAAVPSGFVKETGAAYSATTGRGWVTQASLAGPTHTPLDLSANTRLRTRAGISAENSRLIHLQYGDIVPTPTTGGVLTPGAWEHALPNGRYTVTASVGDQPGAAKAGCAAPCYDSSHVVRAEGVTVVPAFQATAAVEYRSGDRHRRRDRRPADPRRHRRQQHQGELGADRQRRPARCPTPPRPAPSPGCSPRPATPARRCRGRPRPTPTSPATTSSAPPARPSPRARPRRSTPARSPAPRSPTPA